jgi:hypothetical protein
MPPARAADCTSSSITARENVHKRFRLVARLLETATSDPRKDFSPAPVDRRQPVLLGNFGAKARSNLRSSAYKQFHPSTAEFFELLTLSSFHDTIQGYSAQAGMAIRLRSDYRFVQIEAGVK